jgi:uroporphyrinogen decarboxylase
MKSLSSRERFLRIFNHQEADRVPIIDDIWDATIERWHQEGLPEKVNIPDYFGIDYVPHIWVDISPQYEIKTLEETEEYIIQTTSWGVTWKNWKHRASTPLFLNHTIVDPASWESAKRRMLTDYPGRINWKELEKEYAYWKEKDYFIEAAFWFGFDVTHSQVVGTERLLIAMAEEPEWCIDMFNTFLDLNIRLFEQIWNAGYHFDAIHWWDDMGYKEHPFFSLSMYRELLKPVHKRAVQWAHQKGIKAHLHSCGDIRTFIPDLVEIGVDALNPLEVKAGMDPIQIKKDYGDKLVLHGGINAVLWDDFEAITNEMKRVVPVLKENGGYIFSSDHSVPSSVSLAEFTRIIELAKDLGKY